MNEKQIEIKTLINRIHSLMDDDEEIELSTIDNEFLKIAKYNGNLYFGTNYWRDENQIPFFSEINS